MGRYTVTWQPVMPYLIELKPDSSFLPRIAETDAQDWGWLAVSTSTPDVVFDYLLSCGMKMEKYYWYKNCPACQQGRLIITCDITNERLYLHCEECEMGWLNPSDADENKNGFLTLLVDFETKNRTLNSFRKTTDHQ